MQYNDLTPEQQRCYTLGCMSLIVKFHFISKPARRRFMGDLVITENAPAIIDSTDTTLTLMVAPRDYEFVTQNGWVYQSEIIDEIG